jgi:hypothetical protein
VCECACVCACVCACACACACVPAARGILHSQGSKGKGQSSASQPQQQGSKTCAQPATQRGHFHDDAQYARAVSKARHALASGARLHRLSTAGCLVVSQLQSPRCVCGGRGLRGLHLALDARHPVVTCSFGCVRETSQFHSWVTDSTGLHATNLTCYCSARTDVGASA